MSPELITTLDAKPKDTESANASSAGSVVVSSEKLSTTLDNEPQVDNTASTNDEAEANVESPFDFSYWDEPPYESPLVQIDPILDGKLDTFTNDGNMSVVRGIKERVAENYDKYADGKLDETWGHIVTILSMIRPNNHLAERQLLEKSPGTIQSLYEQLGKFVQVLEASDEDDRRKVADNLKSIMVSFVAAYDEKLFDDQTVDTIIEYARQRATDYSATKNIGQAVKIVEKSGDSNCLSIYLDYYRELDISPDNDLGDYRTRADLLRNYFICHGLDAERAQGFRQNVFPLIEQHDPEVENVGASNSWSMEYGGFGISDFIIHSLVSEVNPKNTRDLIQAYREVPTSDFAKFEQNRKDSLELRGVLWRGRDWIHDEVSGIHNVLIAMLDYYETRDNEAVRQEKQAAIIEAMKSIPSNYQQNIGDLCFDLENYEKPVKRRVGETYQTSKLSEETEPAVVVLRRLVENTRQNTLDKPHTEDEQLNTLLEQLRVHPNERTGEVLVSWRQVGQLVAYTNELLISKQGDIGMRPSMVRALAYIDKMATYAMRGVSDRDWKELPYDPHFKEIVKFRDLTSSADKFNELWFETFWESFTRIPNWPDGVEDAYRKLSQRVLDQMNKMARDYNANQYTSYMAESLWSGNLNHELIGLADTRQSFRRYEGLS